VAEVRAVRGDAELEKVANLTTRQCYTPEDYEVVRKLLLGGLRDGTFLRPDLCGVYVDDQGELVASVQALEVEVLLGGAPVRTAGFFGLAVEPALWGRDCVQRLMDAGGDSIQAGGFNLVLGVGIPHYYDRWGAAPVVVECNAALEVRRVRGAPSSPFREATDDDFDLLAALHAEANQARTGFVRWTRPMWRWSVRKAEFYRVRDDAFFGFDVVKDDLNVIDVGARTPGAYRDVVRASCAEAAARGLRRVRATVPPDHDLLRAGIPFGLVVEVKYRETGHWMARILRLRGFFEELRPALARRLREASGPRVALTLRSGDESIALELDGGGPGQVTGVLDLPLRDLTQLAFGYRAVGDVLLDHGLQLAPDLVRALEVLFPPGHAHVWPLPW
jgi:predicted N-acetyltransferase YhbS